MALIRQNRLVLQFDLGIGTEQAEEAAEHLLTLGVEHGVGVLGLGFAGSGARKAHKGTQQGVPQGVCRGVRRAEIVGHGSVLSSVKICKEYSPFIRAIQAAEKSPLTAEGAGNEKIRAMQELLLPASQPAEHDLCRSGA